MKEIKAYVRQSMLDAVLDALGEDQNVPAIAVVPLKELGRAGGDRHIESVSMVKLEIDIGDAHVDEAVACILRQARTGDGHPGDGKVFVSELTRAVRIEDGAELA